MNVDSPATKRIQRRYNRIAPMHDALEWLMELGARRWRRDLQRDTVSTVRAAGFREIRTTNLALDVVKRIEAIA